MRKISKYFFPVFLMFFVLIGCEGAGNITGPRPITNTDDNQSEVKDADLYNYNARFNGGRTARWDKSPVTVYDGIGLATTAGLLQEWNQYIGGKLVLSSNPDADIVIQYGSYTHTVSGFYSDGFFFKSLIEMPNVPHTDNFFKALKHEIGHAVGFLGHTTNGEIMDLGTGSGNIASVVANTITKLYNLPPGTKVVPG